MRCREGRNEDRVEGGSNNIMVIETDALRMMIRLLMRHLIYTKRGWKVEFVK